MIATPALQRTLSLAMAAVLVLAVVFMQGHVAQFHLAPLPAEAADSSVGDLPASTSVHAHGHFHGQPHEPGEHEHTLELLRPDTPVPGIKTGPARPSGLLPWAGSAPHEEIEEPPRA